MSGGATVRSLRNLISRLGSLRQAEDAQPGAGSEPEDTPVVTSKALQRFLAHLGTRPAPVLLDLGPVVGSNISYFGERLNCRFLVENLFECGEWAILEWSDPNGLRGCGFFQVRGDRIAFQRGYFDQLTFFRLQGLPVPDHYLGT